MKRPVVIGSLVVVAVLAYGWLDVRRRARIDRGPRFHRTDFTVYQYAARALKAGDDPYEARNPRGYKYVYPPLLAVLLMPLADIDTANAAYVFFVLSAAALAWCVFLLARVEAPDRLGLAAPLLATLFFSFGFVLQSFQRGQVTLILLALQVAALVSVMRARYVFAGLLLALAIALRLTPILPAAVVGLALLAGARAIGHGPWLRFGGGLFVGLALCFLVIPIVALGTERANEVNERWLDVTKSVYAGHAGELASLERDYKINEYRFKNQAPRRVLSTWMGWLTGAEFVKEKPALTAHQESVVDALSRAVVFGLGLGLILLALRCRPKRNADLHTNRFAVVYALAILLSTLMTRYTWPTHYTMAIPALAIGLAHRRLAPWILFVGTVLFYVSHAKPLEPLGAFGPLMIANVFFVVAFSRSRDAEAPDARILDAFPRDGLRAGTYRAARLRWGGMRRIASALPTQGRIVDLGCGMGLLAHVQAQRAPDCEIIAVDHDAKRIAALRASITTQSIEPVHASFDDVDLPDCDGIALIDVLHYLDEAGQEALLERCADALRPGGVLVLRDPNRAGGLRFAFTRLHEKLAVRLGFTRAKLGRYRTVDDWARALEGHGLTARIHPQRVLSLYADRLVVGAKA